jgi:hypothetical protein
MIIVKEKRRRRKENCENDDEEENIKFEDEREEGEVGRHIASIIATVV